MELGDQIELLLSRSDIEVQFREGVRIAMDEGAGNTFLTTVDDKGAIKIASTYTESREDRGARLQAMWESTEVLDAEGNIDQDVVREAQFYMARAIFKAYLGGEIADVYGSKPKLLILTKFREVDRSGITDDLKVMLKAEGLDWDVSMDSKLDLTDYFYLNELRRAGQNGVLLKASPSLENPNDVRVLAAYQAIGAISDAAMFAELRGEFISGLASGVRSSEYLVKAGGLVTLGDGELIVNF
jgi:hypothetical protein